MAAASFRKLFLVSLTLVALGAIVGFEWRALQRSGAEKTLGAPLPGKSAVWVISLVDAPAGGLVAKGGADPRAAVRLYLDGSYLAQVTAADDGRWGFATERDLTVGRHILRADAVDRDGVTVAARAEVRFAYAPDSLRKALPTSPSLEAPAPAAPLTGESPVPKSPVLEKMSSLGAQLRDLPKGKIFLDAPAAMMLGESREVEARVGLDTPLDALKVRATAGAQTVSGLLAVSNAMSAELTGAGFEIVPESPKVQSVANGFPTVWRWKVKATEEGDRELAATLRALVTNGDPDGQFIDSFRAYVKISVRPLSWTESLKVLSEDVSAAQAISLAGVAMVTAILGWLGISRVARGGASPGAPAKSSTLGAPRGRLRNRKASL